MFRSHSKIWYVDLRTNSDFRSRSFDLLPPTQNQLIGKYFPAELTDGRLTTKRKCIRCSAIVKVSNNGTTKLVNHIKSCENLVIQRILHNDGHFANYEQTKIAMAQTNPCVTLPGPDHAYTAGNRTFRQKKTRDILANFSCRNVPYYLGFVFDFLQTG